MAAAAAKEGPSHQLAEAQEGPVLNTSKGAQPCQHLDSGL